MNRFISKLADRTSIFYCLLTTSLRGFAMEVVLQYLINYLIFAVTCCYVYTRFHRGAITLNSKGRQIAK